MSTFKEILKDHIRYRHQLVSLAISDLKKQYAGTALGIAWALIRPAILIFVFWFAFTFGLRHGADKNGFPFFLWLIAGMIPWFYMRDMFTGGANSIRKYKFLVTKIKYPVSTIPTFVSISNLATHIGLLIIMMIIFMCFGYKPTVYWLQLPVYMLMMFVFFTTWGLFSGMISVISKDFQNLVKSLTQALFWLSGILYDVSTIDSHAIQTVLKFNPVTMAAVGYRNSFIYGTWFWEDAMQLVYFCIVELVMLVLAVLAYKRLKKVIPDML